MQTLEAFGLETSEPSTSSTEVRSASPRRAPAGARARLTNDGCGVSFCDWCSSFGPCGCWQRTLQESLACRVRGWTGFATNWRRRVTKSSRMLCLLKTSAPATGGSASGSLLATPKVQMPEDMNAEVRNGRLVRASGEDFGMNLATQIKMLATPNAADSVGSHGGGQGRSRQVTIEWRLRSLPTPTKQDGPNNGGPSQSERNSPPLNSRLGPSNGLRLQPGFVEYMMAYPIGWTALTEPHFTKPLSISAKLKLSDKLASIYQRSTYIETVDCEHSGTP